MSVAISGKCIVLNIAAVETRLGSGAEPLIADARPAAICDDGRVTAVSFASESDRSAWLLRLRTRGLTASEIALVEEEDDSPAHYAWLEIERRGSRVSEAWLRGAERGTLAASIHPELPPYQRLEVLSRSDSGLSYVRERKSGILRLLTEEELHDFDDPRPCEECGEQFGCDHYNCAGERLLTAEEIDREVPAEWREFATDSGVSRQDLARLQAISRSGDAYRVSDGAASDVRMMELVLLLNDGM